MRPSTAPDDPARPRRARGLRRPLRARNVDANSATRIEILKSAAAAFRKLGYHGATVEQIASALRMKKGNLYYYYRNKEEILFACHQYSLDRLLALLDEVKHSGAGPEEKMRRLIVSFVHTILDELHGTALFLDLEALTPPHLKAVIIRRDQFDRGMRQVIEEGVASGSFGAVNAKLLSFAILGAVNWIPRWFNPDGPASSEDIGQLFADYLIGGLRHKHP
jgi:AcrR family transcriptional regulator